MQRRLGFAIRFLLLLVAFYVLAALNAVNDAAVVPLTSAITRVAGVTIQLFDPNARVSGTTISSGAFAIDVKNGCNAIETMMLFAAAVIAFPAPLRGKILALAVGVPLIQLLNVVRLVTLFWLGVSHRRFFDLFHVAVWQAVMILIGVAIFAAWSSQVGTRRAADAR
ncbi:MAG TPA: exosortase H [Thermoanaerobaculia bacterium]